MLREIDLKAGTWLRYDPCWLPAEEATALLAALLAEVDFEERPVVTGETVIMQPRRVGWAGELPYHYSGQTLPPRQVGPVLAALWPRIEEAVGARFNHAVLNRYRDGRDHMGLHADNEPELGREPVIAALSLGATREFRLELKHRRAVKRTMRLPHGSLLVMGGACQHKWRHAVPRAPVEVGERLNVTFRWLHGPPGWRAPETRTQAAAPEEPLEDG